MQQKRNRLNPWIIMLTYMFEGLTGNQILSFFLGLFARLWNLHACLEIEREKLIFNSKFIDNLAGIPDTKLFCHMLTKNI